MTPILYLHGAHASPLSFNYMRSVMEQYPHDLSLPYNVENGLAENIKNIREKIALLYDCFEADGSPYPHFDIIGHSLGGVIAVALAQSGLPFRRIITMGTPFGGSSAANILKWLCPTTRLYKDISTSAPILAEIRQTPVRCDVLSIVTKSSQLGLFQEPNDGVVTVSSQRSLPGAQYLELELTHFEVLQAPAVMKLVSSYLGRKLLDHAQEHAHTRGVAA